MVKQILTATLLFFAASSFAQDPLFTNTSQSLVYLNPSFAGSNGFLRAQYTYRNQWPELSGNYVTHYGAADAYIKPIKAGISFMHTYDDQGRGTLKTRAFSLIYAQHLSFMDNKLKITPSVKFTYFTKRLDKTKVSFGDQIDPRRGFVWNTQEAVPSQSRRNFDIGSGLLVNYNHFYFGTSVFHINQPDEGLLGSSILPFRLSVHSSYNLHLSEKTLIHFFARYEQQQKFYMYQFNVNALLFKHLIVGAGYLYAKTANTNIGFRHNYFTAQINYGFTRAIVSSSTASTWEFMLSINIRNKENRKALTDFEKW
ncbi:MAG: PorP/SprF family type IX secretion system membrane protein [Bacteroidetes bacterium]|nr:PorP/SprF family type IX secretion system membrane protein [Bacteroidota bacterium]